MTDTFLHLLHSGAVSADQLTDKDRRALLNLVKKSLNSGGGAKFNAPSSLGESA